MKITQYAFVLTKQGHGKTARQMLDALIPSNAIYSFEHRVLAIELARIGACFPDDDHTHHLETKLTGTHLEMKPQHCTIAMQLPFSKAFDI